MKKTLLMLVGLCAAVSVMAQGTCNFVTKVSGSIDAKVTDKATGLPVGTTFLATLYAGPTADSLTPVILTSGAALSRNFLASGYVNGGQQTLQGLTGTVFMQMRAWDGATGATYAAAEQAGGRVGKSNVFQITLGNPQGTPPTVPANLVGLQAFTVEPGLIPEPSVIALGLLGGAALLLRRRS